MTAAEETGARTLAPVVARMRELRLALPAGDGVAVFNRVYLSVTEEIDHRLALDGFADPAAAGQLALDFAGRYLSAVDLDATGEQAPHCWRPLFQARRHRGIHDMQFALAGINAHIGRDLPLAIIASCRALGIEPADLEADFQRTGDVLEGLEEQLREELMPGPDLLDVADPLTHLAGSWSLERARESAWAAALVLWRLQETPRLYAEFLRRLDEGTGLVSRCLLVPLRRI